MAKRERPSQGGATRSTTRKPVTIDLEAEKIETKPQDSADTPAREAKDAPKSAPKPSDQKGETAASTAKSATGSSSAAKNAPATGKTSADSGAKPKVAEATSTPKTAPKQQSTKPDAAKTEASKPGTPKSEPPRPHAAAPPPARRGGLGALTGGLIGGLVVLLGAGGLQWAGILPSLAPQPEMPEPAAPVDLSPLETQISDLQAQLQTLADAQATAPDALAIPADVAEQIAAALAAAQSAEATASSAQSDIGAARTEIETLTDQIETLSAAISTGEAGETAGLEALAARLDAVEASLADAAATAGQQADNGALAALGDELTARVDDLAAQMTTLQDAISGAEARLAETGESMAAMQTETADGLAALEGRLTEAETAIGEATARIDEGGADSAIVAQAVAAAALKAAIDRGTAFMSELETYASVAGEDETVTTLRDYAATGVPTITQLAEGFDAVANAIVATGQGLDENATIADRLMASARSLVQVRPVGEVPGDTPGAIAARIETRLNAGDLTAALAEWEALPDAAKAVSEEFVARMRARQTVDALVANALDGAMAAARPGNVSQ